MATAAPTILDILQEIKIDVRSLPLSSFSVTSLTSSPPPPSVFQHDNIRDLSARFGNGNTSVEKLAIANTIVREIVMHQEAEELTLYPMFKKKGMVEEAKTDQGSFASLLSRFLLLILSSREKLTPFLLVLNPRRRPQTNPQPRRNRRLRCSIDQP